MSEALEKLNERLSSQGWFISPEGLNKLSDNGSVKDIRIITQNALDTDIKEIGKPVLAEKLSSKCIDNVVLQVQKARNISAPKANEESQAAPRMLKLNLTDGHAHCQAIEIDNIGGLSLHKTAPGTKILLKKAPVINGFIFLKPEMIIVLGGKVMLLYEKWELNRNMSNYKRSDMNFDGPPAWVNFGKKIAGTESKDFKSLEDKVKDEEKNTEFDMQRNVAIAEATSGAVKKVFGGGTKPLLNEAKYNERNRETREPRTGKPERERRNKREPKDRSEVVQQKPSEKVSLFAFLEDKLPEAPATLVPNNQFAKSLPTTNPRPQSFKQPQKPPPVEKFNRPATVNNEYNSYPKQYNNYQNKRQNSQPPRLQKKEAPSDQPFDDLAHKMDRLNVNASYAKNAFKQHLNLTHQVKSNNDTGGPKQARQQEQNNSNNLGNSTSWKWNVGDPCMAKYWEDNRYYNATVTALTDRTCVVRFNDYGNMEEVLMADCLPVSLDENKTSNNYTNGNEYKGNRNFVNRNYRRY